MSLRRRSRMAEQLVLHEGIREKPYVDTVGKLTIGVGRNLTDKGLSRTEIEYLLDNDIEEVHRQCIQAFPWFLGLSEVRQRVLMDMAFNMGIAGLLKFKQTLRAVQEARWEAAAEGMLDSAWARQVGQRAIRLATMMRTNEDYTT